MKSSERGKMPAEGDGSCRLFSAYIDRHDLYDPEPERELEPDIIAVQINPELLFNFFQPVEHCLIMDEQLFGGFMCVAV